MRLHVDVLGWLVAAWGAFGALAGTSLIVLALGTDIALMGKGSPGGAELAAVWLLAGCGVLFGAMGAANIWTGRALVARRPVARAVCLALVLPNLVVVPFGTALGVYALWVLLNDDARGQFGRAPARPAASELP